MITPNYLNTPIVNTAKSWNPTSIRKMCIDNDLYTCGDVDEYNAMLAFVDSNEPTSSNMYAVAFDIVNHSDFSAYGTTFEESLEAVLFEILNKAIITSVSLKY